MEHHDTWRTIARTIVHAFIPLLALPAMAQHPPICGKPGRSTASAEFLELVRHQAGQRGSDTVITIPVVFHVLHQRGVENITNEQILDALEYLNTDFRAMNPELANVIPQFQDIIGDARIEFRLATKDPDGNCTSGIERIRTVQTLLGLSTSYRDQWPRDRYLNIWTTRIIEPSAAAVTYYPEEVTGAMSVYDGCMVLHNYTGTIGTSSMATGRGLTHQLAHYLGLPHPWGAVAGECGNEGIDDTPITSGHGFCHTVPENSQVCIPGIYENYQNFMDYPCPSMFTEGQCEWMRATLASPVADRNNLGTAANLALTGTTPEGTVLCAPEADFYAVVGNLNNPSVPFSPTTCVGQNVRFVDNSSRTFPTAWSWTFQDGEPAASSEQNPIVSFTSPGWKEVSLTVTNAQGNTTKVDPQAVLIGDASVALPHGTESFEGMAALDAWVTANNDEDHTFWQLFEDGGCTGNACAWLNSGDRDPLDAIDPTNEYDMDDLISPLMDLSDVGMGRLSFCWAYGTHAADPDSITERLEVFSSNNCGATWQIRATISGPDLITQSGTEAPETWMERTVNLPPALLSSQEARFRFRFVSGHGSGHFFLDNIGVSSTVGMDEMGYADGLSILPNPARGLFTIVLPGGAAPGRVLEITDLRGRRLFSTQLPAGSMAPVELDTDAIGLAAGMYIVRLPGPDRPLAAKLLVH